MTKEFVPSSRKKSVAQDGRRAEVVAAANRRKVALSASNRGEVRGRSTEDKSLGSDKR